MQARNHVAIMEELGLIDFDAAAAVSGSKFYYLRGAAALLELALVNFALQVCTLRLRGTQLTLAMLLIIVVRRCTQGTHVNEGQRHGLRCACRSAWPRASHR